MSRLAVISPRQALCVCAHLPSPLPPPPPSVSCLALWLKSLLSFRLCCSPGLPENVPRSAVAAQRLEMSDRQVRIQIGHQQDD